LLFYFGDSRPLLQSNPKIFKQSNFDTVFHLILNDLNFLKSVEAGLAPRYVSGAIKMMLPWLRNTESFKNRHGFDLEFIVRPSDLFSFGNNGLFGGSRSRLESYPCARILRLSLFFGTVINASNFFLLCPNLRKLY
jgi:hypothetical protein